MENGQKINLLKRTFNFSVEIIKLIAKLNNNDTTRIITKQLLRSATSIGANLEEAQDAHSKKEFIQKMTISLKEARESNYWLRLLNEALSSKVDLTIITNESLEIVKIFTSIVKNSKMNQ